MKHFWMSAEQMLVIIAAVALLHCCDSPNAKAQGIGPVQQPMFSMLSSGGFVLPNSENLWIDFDDDDFALGQVATLVSRTTGVIFTNSAPGRGAIFEGTNGLRFYGTNSYWRYTAGVPLYGSNSFFIVWKDLNPVNTYKPIFGNSGYEREIGVRSVRWFMDLGGTQYYLSGTTYTNVWLDLVYTGGQNPVVWTNGVYSTNNAVMASTSLAWDLIGANQVTKLGDPLKGTIHKLVWWTNGVGLTTNEALSLHDWATNKYLYTP